MWDLPGSGIEPMFPALAGGLLTTGPPRKSPYESLRYCFIFYISRITLYIYISTVNIPPLLLCFKNFVFLSFLFVDASVYISFVFIVV